MEKKYVLNQKLVKRKLLELARTKKELLFERTKDSIAIRKALMPRLDSDILNLKTIKEEYGYCSKTIYRYRAKGLKFVKNSSRGFVFVIRKDLEDYIKKNMYD
ncbi:helix-turn-helix transcriptional regulator [Flavobacterium terrisoli]|uniref:helix-turn-helix transcriptional regulator n=1 Tax=Flavobacterium terrisoli TaxID=3242195 RepID=UPI0025438429|nr:hypothetical protein [Flavobacterium buctense]